MSDNKIFKVTMTTSDGRTLVTVYKNEAEYYKIVKGIEDWGNKLNTDIWYQSIANYESSKVKQIKE